MLYRNSGGRIYERRVLGLEECAHVHMRTCMSMTKKKIIREQYSHVSSCWLMDAKAAELQSLAAGTSEFIKLCLIKSFTQYD